MSFHPNDVARRARASSALLTGAFLLLTSAFFRTQVQQHGKYVLQSEQNRLREIPLPAPRGIIYDRKGQVIAENLPGYSVSVLSPTADSLRAVMRRLGGTIQIAPDEIEAAVRRFRRAPNRPTVIVADAPFDVVSVLEEHRVEFPGLIIQSAPKRYYPDGPVVAAFVGYTGEITESELNAKSFRDAGYKAGQQIGKGGLEKQYETTLRGREGTRFVEVDARGRVVREAGARQDILPEAAPPLYTNIDLDLQKFVSEIFGDSLQGGAIAMDPTTGAVLAIYSAPSYDPNRFTGGIPVDYWKELNTDPRKPLYNKVIQGKYPPGSTFKLATSVAGLANHAVTLKEHMPVACSGGYQFGSRYFKCWDKRGHGSLNLEGAIEKSCDVYFYQLGLKLGVARLVAGGVSLQFRERSGIDLPNEARSDFPSSPANKYYNDRYGPRGWTNSVTLNLSIGQGENAQTVVNMAKFYSALATGGTMAKPHLARLQPERKQLFALDDSMATALKNALAGVVSQGTAAASRIEGVTLGGKTGTAQNSQDPEHHHAWFVGFAPVEKPKILVAVMLEFGGHGTRAAHIASAIVSKYLGVNAATTVVAE